MTDKTRELEAEVARTLNVKSEVYHRQRQAESAATLRVEEEFKVEREAAKAAHSVASIALRNHLSETGSHPWEGKRVTHRRTNGKLGVVQIRRVDSQFPANATWGRPEIGQAFVRLLKKDGTPSLAYDSYCTGNAIQNTWRLAEGETA